MNKTIEILELKIPSGSTPMTIAELIVRECNDREWMEEIVYWLNCWLNMPAMPSEVEGAEQ